MLKERLEYIQVLLFALVVGGMALAIPIVIVVYSIIQVLSLTVYSWEIIRTLMLGWLFCLFAVFGIEMYGSLAYEAFGLLDAP